MGFVPMTDLSAAAPIVQERGEHYGDPVVNWTRIAKLWSAFLGHEVTPHDAAVCMILMKVSRTKQGIHIDNYEDMAGYADIAAMLR